MYSVTVWHLGEWQRSSRSASPSKVLRGSATALRRRSNLHLLHPRPAYYIIRNYTCAIVTVLSRPSNGVCCVVHTLCTPLFQLLTSRTSSCIQGLPVCSILSGCPVKQSAILPIAEVANSTPSPEHSMSNHAAPRVLLSRKKQESQTFNSAKRKRGARCCAASPNFLTLTWGLSITLPFLWETYPFEVDLGNLPGVGMFSVLLRTCPEKSGTVPDYTACLHFPLGLVRLIFKLVFLSILYTWHQRRQVQLEFV